MIYRALGHGSLQVSGIAFGTSRFGRGPERGAILLLRRALDLGINFIDTADEYGGGRSEKLIGQAIAGRREQVALASKFGFVTVPGSAEPAVRSIACDGRFLHDGLAFRKPVTTGR